MLVAPSRACLSRGGLVRASRFRRGWLGLAFAERLGDPATSVVASSCATATDWSGVACAGSLARTAPRLRTGATFVSRRSVRALRSLLRLTGSAGG